MCLSNVKFALKHTVEGLAGIGYKKLAKEGDFIGGTDYLPQVGSDWMTAVGGFKVSPEYVRGFHLFLNPDDAKKYHYAGSSAIGEFLYKDVVAFGDQAIGKQTALCVVAQQIKFIRLLEDKSNNWITIELTQSGKKYLLHRKQTIQFGSLEGEERYIYGDEVLCEGQMFGMKTDSVYQDYLFEEIK